MSTQNRRITPKVPPVIAGASTRLRLARKTTKHYAFFPSAIVI